MSKETIFTPKQYELERAGLKNRTQNFLKATQIALNEVLKAISVWPLAQKRKRIQNRRKLFKYIETTQRREDIEFIRDAGELVETGKYVILFQIIYHFKKSSCPKDLFDYDLIKKCCSYKSVCLTTNF